MWDLEVHLYYDVWDTVIQFCLPDTLQQFCFPDALLQFSFPDTTKITATATANASNLHTTDIPGNGNMFTVNVAFYNILLFDVTSNYNVTGEC